MVDCSTKYSVVRQPSKENPFLPFQGRAKGVYNVVSYV